jgi:hypothetical protein
VGAVPGRSVGTAGLVRAADAGVAAVDARAVLVRIAVEAVLMGAVGMCAIPVGHGLSIAAVTVGQAVDAVHGALCRHDGLSSRLRYRRSRDSSAITDKGGQSGRVGRGQYQAARSTNGSQCSWATKMEATLPRVAANRTKLCRG